MDNLVNKNTQRNRKRREKRKIKQANNRKLATELVLESNRVAPNATRSGRQRNPADPRTFNPILQLGNTIRGREASIKILHPCLEGDNTVVKYPDGAASTSVAMERRDDYVISAPDADKDWNCIVIHNPFLIRRQVFIRWPVTYNPSLSTLQSAYSQAMQDPLLKEGVFPNFHKMPGYENISYCIACSTTLGEDVNGKPSLITARFKSVRRVNFGITTDFDAPDIQNQGRVVSGQWSPDVAVSTTKVKETVDGKTVESVADCYTLQVPAVTSSTITQSDEFSRQDLARTGSYMPIRPCESNIPFVSGEEARQIHVQLQDRIQVEVINKHAVWDLHLRGWCIGVDLWLGMYSGTNLRLKTREILEVIPSPLSPYSPFSTPAYPDDSRAQVIIKEFCRTQPHAFPADYNSLGTMLKKILGSVGGAVSTLGLPVISNIGGAVSKFANSDIGSALAGLLDNIL